MLLMRDSRDGNYYKLNDRKLSMEYFPTGRSRTPLLLNDEVQLKKYNMTLIAGFVGTSFDVRENALKPEIGWIIAEEE